MCRTAIGRRLAILGGCRALVVTLAMNRTYSRHLIRSAHTNTVKPRITGPKSNGNPPITNPKPLFLEIIFRCAVASLYEVVSVRQSVGPLVPCNFRR